MELLLVIFTPANNPTGELVSNRHHCCSLNFLPECVRCKETKTHWILNKIRGSIQCRFPWQELSVLRHAVSARTHEEVAPSTSYKKCQHKKWKWKERMVKETDRETVKLNILTVFLFNEAYMKPSVEFLSSFKSNSSPPPNHPRPRLKQKYAHHKGAATGFHCNSQAVKYFPFSIPSSPTSISTISSLFKHFFVYLYTEFYLRLNSGFLLSKQLNLIRKNGLGM
jgi:hypothetical protein